MPVTMGLLHRKVNTLAGTYTSTEMVIVRNLRLPEFEKTRNVEQQKALIFQSETFKYNVILGDDFLTKQALTPNTAQEPLVWFNNELPLHNPHLLDSKGV
jgi:hypothetical protein